MIEPRKLADFLKPPNWAVTGTTAAIVLLIISGVFAFSSAENSSQAIQMIYQSALVIAGLIGLPLAIWRSWTAHQQVKTGQKQLEGFQRQVALLEAGAEADRLQKGTELLESDKLVVRIAGVAILRSIAANTNHSFQTEAFRVLDAFARVTSEAQPVWEANNRPASNEKSPDDLIEVFNALIDLSENGRRLGKVSIRRYGLGPKRLSMAIGSMLEFCACEFYKCEIEEDTYFTFTQCNFNQCTVKMSKHDFTEFKKCTFSNCSLIGSIDANIANSCQFYRCNLDGLDEESRELLLALRN